MFLKAEPRSRTQDPKNTRYSQASEFILHISVGDERYDGRDSASGEKKTLVSSTDNDVAVCRSSKMATAGWLHGSANMRLTEGLVSVLKEERPEYLPSLLANYREHGVISTQVNSFMIVIRGTSQLT